MASSSERFEVLSHRRRPIPVSGVRALFDEEGWWPDRGAEILAEVLDAGPAVGIWQGGELIAFGRAVTDGHLRAYVEDIVIRKDRRGRGLGDLLVRALHDELGPEVTVSAFFHRSLGGFYGRLGYAATRQVVAHRQVRRDDR